MEQIENAALDFEFLGGGVTPISGNNKDTGRRQLPFYVLVNNDGMSSTAEYDGHAFDVKDGESYLLPRNRVHRLRTGNGEHPVSVWCHFRATLFHSADFLDFFELPEKFLPPDSGRIREACRILVSPPEESPARRLLRRKSAGLRLVEAITAACRERSDTPERFDQLRRLAPAIDFMNRRLDGTHRLEEAAARANLSESRFTVLFKQAMNRAPGAYWQSLRLRRAHELLSAGATPAETAAELGFYDVFHFNRSFKRHFGATPAEFQRRRRERTLPF